MTGVKLNFVITVFCLAASVVQARNSHALVESVENPAGRLNGEDCAQLSVPGPDGSLVYFHRAANGEVFFTPDLELFDLYALSYANISPEQRVSDNRLMSFRVRPTAKSEADLKFLKEKFGEVKNLADHGPLEISSAEMALDPIRRAEPTQNPHEYTVPLSRVSFEIVFNGAMLSKDGKSEAIPLSAVQWRVKIPCDASGTHVQALTVARDEKVKAHALYSHQTTSPYSEKTLRKLLEIEKDFDREISAGVRRWLLGEAYRVILQDPSYLDQRYLNFYGLNQAQALSRIQKQLISKIDDPDAFDFPFHDRTIEDAPTGAVARALDLVRMREAHASQTEFPVTDLAGYERQEKLNLLEAKLLEMQAGGKERQKTKISYQTLKIPGGEKVLRSKPYETTYEALK